MFLLKETYRPLRYTKSQQGLMVYSPRRHGPEPLRSTSRRLGCIVNVLLGPRGSRSTSPFRGLHPLVPSWPGPSLLTSLLLF